MAYTNIESMAVNATFQKRVKVALVKAGLAIVSDAVSQQGKKDLARSLVSDPLFHTEKVALAIATQLETEANLDPTGTGVEDSSIFDQVAAVLDAFVR